MSPSDLIYISFLYLPFFLVTHFLPYLLSFIFFPFYIIFFCSFLNTNSLHYFYLIHFFCSLPLFFTLSLPILFSIYLLYFYSYIHHIQPLLFIPSLSPPLDLSTFLILFKHLFYFLLFLFS